MLPYTTFDYNSPDDGGSYCVLLDGKGLKKILYLTKSSNINGKSHFMTFGKSLEHLVVVNTVNSVNFCCKKTV